MGPIPGFLPGLLPGYTRVRGPPSRIAAPRVSRPWYKDLYDLRHRDGTRRVAATCEEAARNARRPSADVELLTR